MWDTSSGSPQPASRQPTAQPQRVSPPPQQAGPPKLPSSSPDPLLPQRYFALREPKPNQIGVAESVIRDLTGSIPYGNLKTPGQPCLLAVQYVETRTIAAARYVIECVQGRHQLPIKMPCMPDLSRPFLKQVCIKSRIVCPYSRPPIEERLCERHRKNR
jgi:hypothetical protein